ncbi:MAG: RNA-binding S4 domain-containing protein [Pseudomonadota bacterium]|nr:RNA-binding S4 domain-containing protein [Pseudomonadota bacterium]MDP1903356.1 RNA-binding S4 domain-containing protein [Pseudomonadota bacterium]MDP2352326.1 RNA-binding S4 domain-containing protein [Pseudomonadota bacterium]
MSRKTPTEVSDLPRVRLDKWLWAARFYKTRALAHEAIENGRARLEGERVKPGREVRVGDVLTLRLNDLEWVVTVRQLSERRGPASEARLLYAESEDSQAARLAAIEQRRLMVEPGGDIRGRPSKKNMRLIHRFTDSN